SLPGVNVINSFLLSIQIRKLIHCPGRFCCTQYHEHPVPVKVLKSYQIQKDTGFCNIKAVIFRTAKKKLLCADPDKKWVKDFNQCLSKTAFKKTEHCNLH
uniref:Chemokine interleukin-8-like domain-containing protein n=1 Tax=Dicentrarchus labrax TaxID=13489 RepID=A0A8P4KS24_DICLA